MKPSVWTALTLWCVAACASAPPPAETALAELDVGHPACMRNHRSAERAWHEFRASHPLYTQGVALSPVQRGGCRTLILAEPPPHITVGNLQAVAPGLLTDAEVKRHSIGPDGWVSDVVFVLPPLSEVQIETMVAGLHTAMFGTAHRAQTLGYGTHPTAEQHFLGASADVRLTPGELQSSMFAKAMTLTELESGVSSTAEALLDGASPGVYLSDPIGLVVWSLPARARLDEHLTAARQFVLEVDLIVGAIGGETGTLILGRSRQIDVEALPPLRVEVLRSLAAADSDLLAQSFEGELLMAGKLPSGVDWFPAYLSAELVDTEFGGLLHITDALLKQWSVPQNVHFDALANYPQPRSSEAQRPPTEMIQEAGVNSFRLNWNTQDHATLATSGSYSLLAFKTTAALQVTYVNDEIGTTDLDSRLEAIGERYFAALGDPNIVRVAQYAAFYQIARIFALGATPGYPRVADPWSRRAHVLQDAFHEAYARLLNEPTPLIDALAASWWAHTPEAKRAGRLGERTRRDQRAALTASVELLRQRLVGEGDRLDVMAALAASPQTLPDVQAHSDLAELHRQVQAHTNTFLAAIDGEAMLAAFTVREESTSWIRTPSYFTSHVVGEEFTITGGHTLRAAPTMLTRIGEVARAPLNSLLRVPSPAIRQTLGDPARIITIEQRGVELMVRTGNTTRTVSNHVDASRIARDFLNVAGKDAQVQMRNLPSASAQAIKHNLQAHMPTVQVRLSHGGVQSAPWTLAMRVAPRDLSIGAARVSKLANGRSLLEIPVNASKMSTWMKIRVYTSQRLIRPVTQRLQAVLDKFLRRQTGESVERGPAAEALKQELSDALKTYPGSKLEIQAGDVFFLEREPLPRTADPDEPA